MITILCADSKSNYYKIPGLDIWDKIRNAYNYNGTNKVIAHPPCQQWSRLRTFATKNTDEKNLALLCWDIVNTNGGILEHPHGSYLFKYVNADRKKIRSVDQNWWGFPARKKTYLYVHQVELIEHPLSNELPSKKVEYMHQRARSIMTLDFCKWLVNSIEHSY